MKKLVTLLLAAGLVFSAANQASAIEIKPFGSAEMLFEMSNGFGTFDPGAAAAGRPTGTFGFMDTGDAAHNFNGDNSQYHQKHSRVVQRFILGMDIIASESLSAHYDVIAGFHTWGGPNPAGAANPTVGGALGSRDANIVMRQAYLDWIIPNTQIKVRMGKQLWLVPVYAVGTSSPFGDEFGSGIQINAPITDQVGVTVGWLRAVSDNRRTDNFMASTDDNADVFIATVPVKLNGFGFTPWGAFGTYGKDRPVTLMDVGNWDHRWKALANASAFARPAGVAAADWTAGNSTIWWVGFGAELTMFDPFRFALDFAYSNMDTDHSAFDRKGWFVGASAEYKTQWGVPTLKGWWASGDDGDISDGSERAVDFGGFSRSGASSFFNLGNTAGNMVISFTNPTASGTWGISAQWNRFSFVKDLFHNFKITYIRGTNSTKMAPYADPRRVNTYLTTDDSVWEFDIESVYSIYTNLAVAFEFSYILQDIDGGTWAKLGPNGENPFNKANVNKLHFSDAWRLALNFRYTF